MNEKIRRNQKEELVTLEKMIELMIQRGSNLTAINEQKQTPFDLALESNNVKCLK
jgi:ankyrin repeat protein